MPMLVLFRHTGMTAIHQLFPARLSRLLSEVPNVQAQQMCSTSICLPACHFIGNFLIAEVSRPLLGANLLCIHSVVFDFNRYRFNECKYLIHGSSRNERKRLLKLSFRYPKCTQTTSKHGICTTIFIPSALPCILANLVRAHRHSTWYPKRYRWLEASWRLSTSKRLWHRRPLQYSTHSWFYRTPV